MADLKIVEEISSKLKPSKNVLTKIETAPGAKKFSWYENDCNACSGQ